MKGKRHSPEQILVKLREADALLSSGATLGHASQKLAVSEATFHRWRNQYGGMKVKDAQRLKEFETENARLKRMLADPVLDMAILKEMLEGKWYARRGGARRSSAPKGRWLRRSVGPVGRC